MDFLNHLLESIEGIDANSSDDFRAQVIESIITVLNKAGTDTESINRVGLIDAFDFRDTLTKETDRGCALMAGAFLDELLKTLLQEFFVDDRKVSDPIFTGTGGLSSFSSRIDMAYLVGLISHETRRDLQIIRRIRNEFAHSPKEINFNSNGISDRCNELRIHHDDKDDTNRNKFIRASFSIAGFIFGSRIKLVRRTTAPDKNEHIASVRGIVSELRSLTEEKLTEIELKKNM